MLARMRLATILALVNLYACWPARAQIDAGRRSEWEDFRSRLRPDQVSPIT